jgi:PAS domain S-box-containing protein
MKLLAIDDNRDNLTALTAVVRDALPECAVLTALGGPEGLELARAEDPDVILLDIVMPGMDGYEVCRALKADERLRTTPVVFLTALRTDGESRVRALEVGAEGFVSKPWEAAELVAQIRAMAKIQAANRLRRLQTEELSALVAERTRELEEELAERRRAEAALKQEARLTRVLLDAFPCPALLLRPATREIVASNRAAAAVGAVAGATCFGTWGQREAPCPWCLAPAAWESGRAQHLEVEASGTVWDAHWIPVADDLYMHYALDVTERRRADAERERLLTAIEQAGEGVLVTDPEGVIQYVNPAFEADSGYTRAEILGKNPRLLKSGRHDEGFYRGLWETVSAGRTWQSHIVNRRKDGTLYTQEATISPVRDAGGRIMSYVAVTRDITEHLRLAEQLRQAQKMEAVGRLAGGVAHDFNNLLTVINGLAELAAADLDSCHPLVPRLQGILDAGTRAARLTQQLLAFARKQVVAPRALDLNEAIGAVQGMLRRLIGEDIELVWKPGADVWRVYLDPGQVDQVLANLLVNARDAIPGAGTVTVETGTAVLDRAWCEAHPGAAPGEYAVLTVSDTGEGMDRETLTHIFEPFFTTKGPGRGTGLGLATVYGIVQQAGGAIYAYSEPGQGTTFRIYLPRWTGGAGAAVAREEPAAPPAGTETVLLVEDEPAILTLGQAILERQGYRVLAARSPAEALGLAAQEPGEIHLLATDVVLPGMNGRELYARLHALRPGLKCLYLSGYTADAISQRGVLPDGVSFLQKPYSLKTLAEKVRAVLDDAR